VGGAHSPAAKGVGESQFQRLEKRLALCLLCGFLSLSRCILYTKKSQINHIFIFLLKRVFVRHSLLQLCQPKRGNNMSLRSGLTLLVFKSDIFSVSHVTFFFFGGGGDWASWQQECHIFSVLMKLASDVT
jgi:hypothetical protein